MGLAPEPRMVCHFVVIVTPMLEDLWTDRKESVMKVIPEVVKAYHPIVTGGVCHKYLAGGARRSQVRAECEMATQRDVLRKIWLQQ